MLRVRVGLRAGNFTASCIFFQFSLASRCPDFATGGTRTWRPLSGCFCELQGGFDVAGFVDAFARSTGW
jgi:hypothetical protein